MLRHASTRWNELGKIQGSSDVPLSARGVAQAQSMVLPAEFRAAPCFSSPLLRCRQTAFHLQLRRVQVVDALTEMHWGEWEGATLAQMKLRLGTQYREQTARALDFRPAGGETPREVMQRVQSWLTTQLEPGTSESDRVVIVTHKGVMRAVLALASGWDMRDEFPQPLDWRGAFGLGLRDSRITLESINVPLMTNMDSSVDGAEKPRVSTE